MSLKNKIRKIGIDKSSIIIAHPSLRNDLMGLKIEGVDFRVPIIFTENVKNIRAIKKENLQKVLDDMNKASA